MLTSSDEDKLHTTLCRLSIQVLHFFKNQTILTPGCLSRVLATACGVVDHVKGLGERIDTLAAAPVQVNSGVLLASISLLRILKIFASQDLDIERARSSFFTAIHLAKQMSFETNDAAAKAVIILNQLWNSTKAFRKSDGSEYTALRIRSRLVLSPVVDAVWWWRDEFDPQARAMQETDGIFSGLYTMQLCELIVQESKLAGKMPEQISMRRPGRSDMNRSISTTSSSLISNGRWATTGCFLPPSRTARRGHLRELFYRAVSSVLICAVLCNDQQEQPAYQHITLSPQTLRIPTITPNRSGTRPYLSSMPISHRNYRRSPG